MFVSCNERLDRLIDGFHYVYKVYCVLNLRGGFQGFTFKMRCVGR